MEKMLIDDKHILKYDQKNAKIALDKISNFEADLGTTNILDPITEAINMSEGGKWTNKGQKRVFMLTDGFVGRQKEALL